MTDKNIKYTQHFTNHSYQMIANLMKDLPDNIDVQEPFFGKGDLVIPFMSKIRSIDAYDIDKKLINVHNDILVKNQDTLINPPDQSKKYIITNPPYLSKNHAGQRFNYIFANSQYDDFYKIAIHNIKNALGGILVVPLNFLTDQKSSNIRNYFFSNYQIKTLNVFNFKAFDETNYQTCAFSFFKKENRTSKDLVKINIFSSYTHIEKQISTTIYKENNWKLFDSLVSKYSSELIVNRITNINKNNDEKLMLPIVFNLIDKSQNSFKNLDGEIKAVYDKPHISKSSERILLSIQLNQDYYDKYNDFLSNQKNIDHLITEFNRITNALRTDTGNIIFSSFRDFNRKRISFNYVYQIISYLIINNYQKDNYN